MKHIIFNFYTLITMAVVLAGISCSPTSDSSQASSEKVAVSEPRDVLRHVVAFTFKDEITDERQEQAVKDFVDLKNQVPGIISFEGGKDVSIEGLTKGFTHCFIITFVDEKARDEYIPHPAHLVLVEKNKPLMKNLLVLDFWGQD
ncbi:MAG: Dabb family protein [Cyclobacteriaceae bacterium]